MAACKIDLRNMITGEASDQGVPPELALAVAAQESSICQWDARGNIKRGASGEYGVMQLMPATAASLGVDPANVQDNIHGGVKFLRQLYDRYGDWTLAVQHYNGSGPRAVAYAQSVMAIARGYGYGLALAAQTSPPSSQNGAVQTFALPAGGVSFSKNTLIAAGIVAGAGLLAVVIAS